MTALRSREVLLRAIAEPFSGPPWRAMLRQAGVRRRLLAVAVLTAIFLSVLMTCLGHQIRQRAADQPRKLIGLFETAGMPGNLPGSPQSVADPETDEPASLLGNDAVAQNARAPFVAPGSAARPFRFSGSVPERIDARACLAAAMVYEAGDDAIGQLAVGQVILNRARHPAFPASVCGVVSQGSDRATGCQFTFTCDGSLARSITLPVRARTLAHADLMLDGLVFTGVGLATHYHTNGVYPWWSPRIEKIARVGAHLFFRWPGFWGSSRVFVGDRHASEPSAAMFAQFTSMPLTGDHGAQLAGAQLAGAQIAPRIKQDVSAATAGIVGHGPDTMPASGAASLARASAIPVSRRLSNMDAGGDLRQPLVPSAPALQGVRLLRMFPDDGVFYLQLAPGSTAPAHKRAAEQLCGGRTECQVYGWWSADAAPHVASLDATSRAALTFKFVRHADLDTRSRPPSAITM